MDASLLVVGNCRLRMATARVSLISGGMSFGNTTRTGRCFAARRRLANGGMSSCARNLSVAASSGKEGQQYANTNPGILPVATRLAHFAA